VALAGAARASTTSASYATSYRFETLNNAHDVTFNQLLGINDEGLIAGYFGSGAAGHLNQGYLDPGHRAEQPRRHGGLLVQHEHGQHDEQQLRLR
jgi:hypothetical protein